MSRLLFVHEPGGSLDAAFDGALGRLADSFGCEMSRQGRDETAFAELPEFPSQALLVVLAPDVQRPLAVARRLARAAPEARFVLATTPAAEASLRREAVVGAPAGGRWTICLSEEASLRQAVESSLRAIRTQRKLRTTLDRAKFNLQSTPALDPIEYRRLVASDRYLARVLESAHDAIVALDPKGRVVSWNGAAQRLFQRDTASARDLDFSSLFDRPEHAGADLASILDGERDTAAWSVTHGDGVTVQLEAALGLLRDDAGSPTGVVVILRDVTERQAAERTLRESNRQKDEFLAMLSHELRNPLAPIRNAAELLKHLPLPDTRARKAVDIINRQVGHMASLVEELLDVARVTRGTIELDRRPVQLSAALADAIEQARDSLERAGHHLTLTETDRFACVLGDRTRLTQIFSNLLVNSAKYTPHGGNIRVELGRDRDDAVVRIIDDGSGIPAHVLPRVFDLFAQGERRSDRSQGGLGIGLALVRSLTELHGGTVDLASPGEGQGATATVRLPRMAATSAREATKPALAIASKPARLRVMVVDDNQDAAQTLGLLLETEGHSVDVEVDPREALARAPALRPDVFILDIGMPYLDGYELARRIIALQDSPRPLLIALTGYSQPIDKESARLAGFDHHLSKPLDPAQLQSLLSSAGTASRH